MYSVLIFKFILAISAVLGVTEKMTYVSVEHPLIKYCNPNYGNGTFVSRRYSRSDPVYYVNMNFVSYVWFGNNFTIHIFFYEFLSNVYKRNFVELHVELCDLVEKGKYFGPLFRQGRLAGPCPFPPGDYNISNLTLPSTSIPRGWPFTKGRVLVNITFGPSPEDEIVVSGQIDMEIRQLKRKEKR